MQCVLVLGIENIMLTIEDEMIVIVSCCAALSFSTSVMASVNVCGSFSDSCC